MDCELARAFEPRGRWKPGKRQSPGPCGPPLRQGAAGGGIPRGVGTRAAGRSPLLGERGAKRVASDTFFAHYEAEARKRQLSPLKKGVSVSEKIHEREQGKASDQAARDLAKELREEGILPPRILIVGIPPRYTLVLHSVLRGHVHG